jgi:DNA-directed RNA polymerase specialized sigma24 family protein
LSREQAPTLRWFCLCLCCSLMRTGLLRRDPGAILEEIFRRESGRIVATLVRIIGDIDLAEEILQETIVSAIEHWPASGVPDNPSAWLTTVAKNRATDALRRAQKFGSISEQLAREQAIDELHGSVNEHPDIPTIDCASYSPAAMANSRRKIASR